MAFVLGTRTVSSRYFFDHPDPEAVCPIQLAGVSEVTTIFDGPPRTPRTNLLQALAKDLVPLVERNILTIVDGFEVTSRVDSAMTLKKAKNS
jgi:hypothetical protein